MKVVDYLKVSFKKPELSESIAQIIEKKNRITTQLEFCYSRLESIELCNSSSKPNDALLLSNFLIIDIMNLALFYSGKSIITANEKWEEKISSLSEPDLISAFTNHKTVKDTTYKSEEEQSEEIESSLSNLLQSVEKFIFNKNKSQFENPVDDYDKKIKFQLLVGIIVSAFLIHFGIKTYHKTKPIKNDVAKIYYMNQEILKPSDSNMVTADVTPSEDWKEVNFVLPTPQSIKDIKVEPVHQIHARFQIKEIKYLDEKKNVIKERNFKLDKAGIIANTKTNEICCTEDIKPGKLLPDKYLELESIDSSPAFYIKMEETKDVKEIVLTFRYIKNKKKFLD